MRLTKVCSPVTTSDGHDGELRDDDCGANCSRDFLGRLDSEPDVTLAISDDDNGLETRTLSGAGLLLHWLDLQRISNAL